MITVDNRDTHMNTSPSLNDLILITGATGFIGTRLLLELLRRGFRNLRCVTRSSSNAARLEGLTSQYCDARIDIVKGNLLFPEDCAAVAKDVKIVFHLAAGRGEKAFADAFMNSVVTTRNLLDALVRQQSVGRFVNISSFAVYSNKQKPRWHLLDETCPVEPRPESREDAYCFAKAKQDDMVIAYGKRCGLPYVIVRPGYVYGPGNKGISGRVGINTFGMFVHLGGSSPVPLTYVDNCVDAIVLAGITSQIVGEVFNIVDDNLPSSRQFLRGYKRNVRQFRSLYVPHVVSYVLCYLWEMYSRWSRGQLPPAFNRSKWHAYWKPTRYSNDKAKKRLNWMPRITTTDGLGRYFESLRELEGHA